MYASCHGSQWPKVCELAQFTMAESRRVSATQEFVEDFVEMKSYVLFPTTSQIFQMCRERDAVAASHEITVCRSAEVQSLPRTQFQQISNMQKSSLCYACFKNGVPLPQKSSICRARVRRFPKAEVRSPQYRRSGSTVSTSWTHKFSGMLSTCIEVGAHSTDDNENRARSYREQVLEEHDTIQATRYRGP
jgi:hypothetical protein